MNPLLHTIVRLSIASALLAGLQACAKPLASNNDQTPAAPGQPPAAPQERVSLRQPPAAPQADIDSLAQGNTAFAVDLYHRLGNAEDNCIFSPYSISLSLAMVYAGARGSTAEQMAQALHFDLPPEQLHPAFNALDQALTAPVEIEPQPTPAGSRDNPESIYLVDIPASPFQINISNALWGQQGYAFLPEFVGTLEANYGAGLETADFIGNPEEARHMINQWIETETQGKINDLISPDILDSNTRLVLANAIYFYGPWLYPFEKSETVPAPFTLLDGSTIQAEQMRVDDFFLYYKGDSFQAVQLPYDTRPMAMTILMPDRGQFENFQASLDATQLATILAGAKSQGMTLRMPRFKFETFTNLNETLQAMGMVDAYLNADFSGMSGNRDLRLAAVLHKAFIGVDEEGTEAAAATAAVILQSAPMITMELTIDRPFIFLIHDLESGTIIFMGQVLNPAQ